MVTVQVGHVVASLSKLLKSVIVLVSVGEVIERKV